jgi:hypothetical protein
VDSTAVFQCVEAEGGECSSTLHIVRNGEIEAREVKREINGSFRSRFGLKVPRELIFTADDGLSLKIVPVRPIESGFCDVKIVARMGLYSAGEKLHETMGIMAILAPGRLRGKLIRTFVRPQNRRQRQAASVLKTTDSNGLLFHTQGTRLLPCANSVASYRMPMIASAPISWACWTIRLNASISGRLTDNRPFLDIAADY